MRKECRKLESGKTTCCNAETVFNDSHIEVCTACDQIVVGSR